jgi:Flp pilus assembly pilin Flp
MNKNRLKSFIKDTNGIAAIEFAFIFPIIVGLFFALIDITQLITNNRKATTVADAVANLVGQSPEFINENELRDFYQVARIAMAGEYSEVRINIQVFRNNRGTFVPRWSHNNSRGQNCGRMPTVGDLTAYSAEARDVIVVQTCYLFKPFAGPLLWRVTGQQGTYEYQIRQTVTTVPRDAPSICSFKGATQPAAGTCVLSVGS